MKTANSKSARVLTQYHNRSITITFRAPGRGGSVQEVTRDRVKVITATPTALIIRGNGLTEIVEADSVIEIRPVGRPRRKRVTRRLVRMYGQTESVKQHLADRHGILVSVLNAVDEATAHETHRNINHGDLGHQHGDHPNRSFVDPQEAAEALESLGIDGGALATASLEGDNDD